MVIRVTPHPVLQRQGVDLFVEMPLSFSHAALGTEVLIPTLKDKVRLKIPPGTQSGTIFRLRGRGIPELHGQGTGDLHVQVTVQTPTKLSAKQKSLLEELAKEGKETLKPTKGFFEKVKDVFVD